jgi:F-type H+-transporting ATPase subunit b
METILGILGSVGFNWHVALANFVNFLIILYILNRFIFKKVGKTIDDRNQVITQGLKDAHDAHVAKAEASAEKSHILRTAEAEAHTIVNEAHKKGELLSVSMKEKATDEAHAIIQDAEKKKASAYKEAEKEFRDVAPRLIAELTEKALRTTMTKELNDKLVASA